ncbi:hypothetical protein T492DRAFT_895749, partial [Pavlovales sp. CCMP2436]
MPAHRGSLILAACALALGQAPCVVRLKWPTDSPVDAVQYTVNAISPKELASMASFFANMPLDPYLDTVLRTRHFGKYMLYNAHSQLSPHKLTLPRASASRADTASAVAAAAACLSAAAFS